MATPSNSSRQQVVAWVTRGHEELLAGRHEAAVAWFRRALDRDPSNFDALQLLGLSRIHAGQFEDGVALLRRALAINPGEAGVHNNLGNALLFLGRRAEAVEALRHAFALLPTHTTIGLNLANAQRDLGDLAGSITTLAALLQRQPAFAAGHFALALGLTALGRNAEALVALDRTLALDPNHAQAHVQRGLSLAILGDPSAAHRSLAIATERAPPELKNWATLMQACMGLEVADWSAWAAACVALRAGQNTTREALDPMRAMLLPGDDQQLAQLTSCFVGSRIVPGARRPAPRQSSGARDGRIRLAYLSPDFGDHPVCRLAAPVLRSHDRARFSVSAYGWGAGAGSWHREYLTATVDRFVDVSYLDDASLAGRLRADGIDIAIDLAGYTAMNRARIFLERLAPVQVGWLGYPGTMGCDALDYLIADATSVPAEASPWFAEQIVRLPGCALPYDTGTSVARAPSRRDCGLPENGVVLACFAQARKLNPLLFDVWMAVLRVSPDVVLWLAQSNPEASENLRRSAALRGVDPARLVIAERAPSQSDYLARYRVADLTLDTFPYGSHSTALDVLWAGCPLLALAGLSMASRVSSAILRAAALDELICSSLEDYGIAIRQLVREPAALRALRARVERARDTTSLFNLPEFVGRLESAYAAMHARAQAGLPPAAFEVA